MKLEQWSYHLVGDAFTPPELAIPILSGLLDGEAKSINVNRIASITDEGKMISIGGKEIELGEPSPEYEKTFPNARNRILKTLRRLCAVANVGRNHLPDPDLN